MKYKQDICHNAIKTTLKKLQMMGMLFIKVEFSEKRKYKNVCSSFSTQAIDVETLDYNCRLPATGMLVSPVHFGICSV